MRIKHIVTTSAATTLLALALSGAPLVHAQTTQPPYDTTGTTVNGTTNTSDTSAVPSSGTNGTNAAADTGVVNTTGVTDEGTPGVPNTGAGGDATTNVAVLAVLAAVALGSTYLLRRRA
jgi:hypothetical protein